MRIAAPLVNLLMNYAECRGVNRVTLEKLLDKPIDLCDDANTVTVEEYERVLGSIADSVGDAALGLSYGSYLNLSALGIVYKVSLAASNMTQAIKLLGGYLKNNFPVVAVQQLTIEDKVHISLSCSISDSALHKHVLDATFSFIYRELCLMMDKSNINLAIPHSNTTDYAERLNAAVVQGNSYAFVIDDTVLEKGFNKKSLTRIEILLPQFLLMLGAKGDQSFAAATRDMILHMCTPELPTLEQVCRQFAMSDRTFQRKLNSEETSYREITNEIKKILAAYLHAGDKMKTQDIAHILGYSESSAYLHAAKAWDS